MAQHANRSSSVRGIQPKNLVSDELPSFSLGLTQDEDFNLGSTTILYKEGVSIEEVISKHRNDPKKIVKIMKRKVLTKSSSPKPTKFQKLVKRRKSNEKGESSKIASPVASDYESKQKKVEEVWRIYVDDSLSAAGHDTMVLAEIEKLAEVIPICLFACKFYENKGIDIDNHPNYKLNDKMDLFGVSVMENVPQQPSGSLDCGLYMVTYVEYLTFGESVSAVDFDPDLIRIRYASLLWNYDTRKAEAKVQSDDEARMRSFREIELTEGFPGGTCISAAKLHPPRFPEVLPSHLYVLEDKQEDHTFSTHFLACID
ncbi:hypothetical protein FXO38_13065 [Capsicum annuum]|nr:hypothetical protein FXO38_13065 [Capsicum annuum]